MISDYLQMSEVPIKNIKVISQEIVASLFIFMKNRYTKIILVLIIFSKRIIPPQLSKFKTDVICLINNFKIYDN